MQPYVADGAYSQGRRLDPMPRNAEDDLLIVSRPISSRAGRGQYGLLRRFVVWDQRWDDFVPSPATVPTIALTTM